MSRREASCALIACAGLWVGMANCDAAPGRGLESKREKGAMTDCFKDAGVDLGIPAAAVFFLAEVSVEGEPMANRRWFVKSNGAVHFGENSAPLDFARLSKVPFNRPFGRRKIASLPLAELNEFLAWLDAQGLFQASSDSSPPAGVTVSGGVDRWVVVRRAGRTECARLRPGSHLSESLKQRFGALVRSHMP